jgi:hypothetical protein
MAGLARRLSPGEDLLHHGSTDCWYDSYVRRTWPHSPAVTSHYCAASGAESIKSAFTTNR